ncbi:AAA family ATPase, partial [Anabaena sp. UHCC 0399]|uniref:AAA family ATPase n=1 Tax=Anabaena sp. UHCC 0399 TaxID=3110238 RepID=UPI002B1EB66B
MTDWKIFQGNSEPHDNINQLPPPPSWRKFLGADDELVNEIEQRWQKFSKDLEVDKRNEQRGKSFRIHTVKSNDKNTVINMVNAALYLRRPLLITGKPGTGKTSLAYAVAYELKLGAVLP